MDFLDLPLEAFSPQMVDQALEEEARIMDLIKASDQEIETIQGRLLETKKKREKIAGLSREIELARQDRSKMLALGEDHTEISGRIAKLQKELEACEADSELLTDEESGLNKLLDSLHQGRQALVKDLELAQDKTKAIGFHVVANEYNAKAEELARVVSEVWQAYDSIPDRYRNLRDSKFPHPKDVWFNSALARIPVLRKDWSKASQGNAYHFFKM